MNIRKLLARGVLAACFCGLGTVALSDRANAQMIVGKTCSRCGQVVPISSQVGQTCPHCGATWGKQETEYVSGLAAASGSWGSQAASGMPIPPNVMLEMARMQDQIAQRQMVLDRYQKQREAKAASREQFYKLLRAKSDADRQRVDPELRGQRYLLSAIRSENHGDLRGAIAYYGLAIRFVPGSSAAEQASAALKRLGVEDPSFDLPALSDRPLASVK